LRLKALDGLRGIAALVVLVHHSLLVVPSLAAPYFGGSEGGGRAGLLVNTPLHLLWAGTEAVYLFFVLSGLVLAFSLRSGSFQWSSYLPSRFARLYFPVFGAVALGAVVMALTPDARPDDSLWARHRPGDYDLPAILADLTLVGGTSIRITPLWSLQWEVVFSALLPLYIYASRRLHVALQLGIFFALATLGAYANVASLKYLPMFGIGVALASVWDALSDRLASMPRRRAALFWVPALAVAVLLVTSFWTLRKVLPADLAPAVTLPLILVGICLLIIGAANAPLLSDVLSGRVFGFLGLISFSLYLVHEPLVMAVAAVVPSPAMVVFVALPLSIVVAVGFWLAIERPSHRLSRRIRRGVEYEHRLAA
jgi:peptidoglycan/LPS O-acetylase OafA/YrhL